MFHRYTSKNALSDVEDVEELQKTWGTSCSPAPASPLQQRGESAPVMQSERVMLPEVRSLSSAEGISAAVTAYNAGSTAQQHVQQQPAAASDASPPAAAFQQLHIGQQGAAQTAAPQRQAPPAAAPAGPSAQVPPDPFAAAAAPAGPAAFLDPFGGAAAAPPAALFDPFGGAAAAAAARPPPAPYFDPFGGAASAPAPAPAAAAPVPAPAAQAAFDPFGAAARAPVLPDPFAQVAAAPLPPPPAALALVPEADFSADLAAWGPPLQELAEGAAGGVAAAAGGGGAGGGRGGGGAVAAAAGPEPAAGGGPGAGAGAAAAAVVLPSLINTCTLGDDGDCIVETGMPMGRGSFGSVFPGYYYDDRVAVKMLHVEQGIGVEDPEAAVRQRILREVQLQARAVSHSGVVKFVAVCLSPPAIVMEMCACSLSERINNHWATQQAAAPAQQQQQQPHPQQPQQQERPSWPLVVQLLRQAAAALAFLHRQGQTILHNDLRAANMVLTHSSEPGGAPWKLKICDFGLAVAAEAEGTARVPEVTHSSWRAPELDEGYDADTRQYTVAPPADVFALGCVLSEMLVPGLPQPHFPAAEARLPALAGPPPGDLQQLFQDCVQQVPQQRPPAQVVWRRLRTMQVA